MCPARFGGAETVILALVRGLRDRGLGVKVLAAVADDPSHPFLAALRQARIETVTTGPAILAQLGALRELISSEAGLLLHSHGYRSDVLTRLAGSRRCRLVSTVHGFTGGGLRVRTYEELQRRALRGFDRVVAVSGPLGELLSGSGVSPARLRVIANRLPPATPLSRPEARTRLGLPQAGTVIGWVGRLSHEKGPDLGLEALARLPDRDWIGAFLGSGPESRALRDRAEALGLGNRIRWLGDQPEAGRLMTGFDVLLSSSRTEGTPMVLLEAMTAGIPIVAFAVGGIPDLMARGPEAGFLVPPGQPEDLAQALAMAMARVRTGLPRQTGFPEQIQQEYEGWVDQYVKVYREAGVQVA